MGEVEREGGNPPRGGADGAWVGLRRRETANGVRGDEYFCGGRVVVGNGMRVKGTGGVTVSRCIVKRSTHRRVY